ncbi:hypothetical protein JLBYU01_28 [Escherichia phage JLBYU01]|nr:hypothetical protein JLBYU01_28 [Escherichia phage JLBYU01]
MAVITENDLDLAEAFCRAARANLDVTTKFLPARPLFSCAPVNKPTRVMIVIEGDGLYAEKTFHISNIKGRADFINDACLLQEKKKCWM